MTVKTKITLPLIVAVVVVGLLAAWLVAWQLGGLEKAFTSRIVDNKIEEAKSGLAAAGGFAVEQASVLGGAPEVLAAYESAMSGNMNDEADPAAQKAREALRVAFKPMLEAYSQANDGKKLQLHFHLPNNRSLVRLWRPKQIKRDGKDLDVSDDLTSFRPTVVEANKSLKPVKGVEIGVGGFAVRGVAPVKSAAGKHLGSNEVLVEFTPILSRLASGPDEDVALFMNADLLPIAQELQDKTKYPLLGEKFVRVIAPKTPAVLEAIDPALLEAGRAKTTIRLVGGRTLAAFPIKDFRDAQVGVAVYALDASSTAGFISGVTWTVVGALLAVLLIPLATIRLAFRRFVDQPLTDIIKIIKDITEDRADLGARLSEASQDEIGELAKWFNKLLHKLSDMICLEESVINAMPDPLFVVDENYRIKIANKATAKIAGKTPTELMGTRCADIFRTPACDTPECPIAMRMRDQNRTELIDTFIGGERVVIRPIVDKMTDCDGKVIGYLELAQIVTPMVVKEEALQANLARIAEVNREITEAAAQIGASAESVAGRVSDVAHGAGVQRQRVDETVTAMEEMNAVVLEVARNAADAARQTDETRDKANRGEEVARESVSAIEQARKLALDLKTKMDALGRRAEDIGKVVDVISDIADQTNLLALNAAIEAARAGDAGRGFAVVADEVRKLAEKTMNATGEVGQSIQAIQRDAKDSVSVTEQAAKAVGKGVELTQNSGAALAEIKELVNKAADQVQAIAAAAEEQSASAEEVQRAVEDISRVSSETADGMNKASDSISELTGIVTRLTELARK